MKIYKNLTVKFLQRGKKMNFSLFRHELKLMIQSRKNNLFILFFLIGIVSYVFIILPEQENLETFNVEQIEAQVMELDNLQQAREGRRHTGGGFAPTSFYSSNNYKHFLFSAMLNAFEDQNYERLMRLRTFYLEAILQGQIMEEEMFKDSVFRNRDRSHYIEKKLMENKKLLSSDVDITYEMIEEKSALQVMKNIFLSFGPFLLLFSAIYFSNDILVRDSKQTTTVHGLPISWYQYLNTKSIAAFSYTVIVTIFLFIITLTLLTIANGFGSFQMGVPILHISTDDVFSVFDYELISIFKYFLLTLSLAPIFMFVFIRLSMILSLIFRNEWIVLILSSLFLFSERIYDMRGREKLLHIGIDKFPQTYFDFGQIVTGEKDYLIHGERVTFFNVELLSYNRAIIVAILFLVIVEVLLLLFTRWIPKNRFYKI